MILAIETSASACSLAIRARGITHVRHEVAPMQQAARILPLMSELLATADIVFSQLDAVAFGQGPGSFTGLRIAASVAGGLAFALQIPVIPVCSLAVLAHHAAGQNPESKNIVAAVDARMGEIYWATFHVDAARGVHPVTAPSVSPPETLSLPHDGHWVGAGNAWAVYGSQMGCQPWLISEEASPRADAMLALAEAAYRAGNKVAPQDAGLVYLRNNVTFRQSTLDSPPSGR